LKIGLDASYSVGGQPSGVGVYCRAMLEGLPRRLPGDCFRYYYRPHVFLHACGTPRLARRLLLESGFGGGLDLFHGLNQRLPATRYRRTVVTFHDLFVLTGDYSSAEFRQRFARQAREAAARADLIIAVSHFTASQVIDLLGVDSRRVRVVWHGVEERPAPVATGRTRKILSVGTLQRRKNTARLVEAFERAALADWELVLVGAAGGFGAGEALEKIEQSPSRERIRVTGWLPEEELNRYWAEAAVFAFPSLDEGFGMPLLDAMQCRVPILTSARSALPEVAGDAALLVDPFSVEEMAEGLRQLAEDEGLRQRLAEAGARRVKDFSWDAATDQTAALYNLISARR
jgi:glycosyltransferase involved in cell wall biosynthesis